MGVRFKAGFDSGQAIVEDWNSMGVPAGGSPLCRIIPRLICWYLRWYRQPPTIKTTSASNSYGIKRLSARGTKEPFTTVHRGSPQNLKKALSFIRLGHSGAPPRPVRLATP
jgi:hypothetical protein